MTDKGKEKSNLIQPEYFSRKHFWDSFGHLLFISMRASCYLQVNALSAHSNSQVEVISDLWRHHCGLKVSGVNVWCCVPKMQT